ncbi:IF-2B-domain-containing protein [Atractiella rhizophila]|nr:IF-2B-domain-containing protein [Atractiella rhizophila]
MSPAPTPASALPSTGKANSKQDKKADKASTTSSAKPSNGPTINVNVNKAPAITTSAAPNNRSTKEKLPVTPTATTVASVSSAIDQPSHAISSLLTHLPSATKPNNVLPPNPVHPKVQALALEYSTFAIAGSNARAIAMLEAFKQVIRDYRTPKSEALSRHLLSHISHQISYLVERSRPLSTSMGNAIRYLKWEITKLGQEKQRGEDEAKAHLIETIDYFIRDRIVLADKIIQDIACSRIKESEVVMVYGRSSVIESVLLAAHRSGKRFSVIVVDSPLLHEGRTLLPRLLSLAPAISVTYLLLPSVGSLLQSSTPPTLFLSGAHTIFSNGSVMARSGTSLIASLVNKKGGIPVVFCCETYKFSEKVALESVVINELAPKKKGGMENELLYDVTTSSNVTCVISEAGMVPVESAAILLREFKPILAGAES